MLRCKVLTQFAASIRAKGVRICWIFDEPLATGKGTRGSIAGTKTPNRDIHGRKNGSVGREERKCSDLRVEIRSAAGLQIRRPRRLCWKTYCKRRCWVPRQQSQIRTDPRKKHAMKRRVVPNIKFRVDASSWICR
jgi:hypothetical protein